MEKLISAKRLGAQLLVVISAGLIFLAGYFIVSDYHRTIETAKDDTMERLETVAKTVAVKVDGNQHQYLVKAYPNKDDIRKTEDNLVYEYLHSYMRKVQLANGIATDIYTIFYDSTKKAAGETPFYFGVTSGETPYFRHPYENYPSILEESFREGGRIPVFTDEHGTWLSYFAPIENEAGEVVAVVMADQQFDEFLSESRKEAVSGLTISLIVFLIVGLLMVFIVRKIIRIDEIKSEQLMDMHEQVKAQHKDITDSINYSERIQRAIIPSHELIRQSFPNSFMFYKARDVVSGDFPWVYKKSKDVVYLAAVDCTGHGVPGSMMSFIGYFLLNEILGKPGEMSPAEVLGELNAGVVKTLQQEHEVTPRDGMDIALCKVDFKRMELSFSGAHRPLYLLRGKELIVHKGDREVIGGIQHDKECNRQFTNTVIPLEKGDSFYIFSDGLQDQFGGNGERKKKYSSKRIREILVQHSALPIEELGEAIEKDFMEWMSTTNQIDDVLLIGVKF